MAKRRDPILHAAAGEALNGGFDAFEDDHGADEESQGLWRTLDDRMRGRWGQMLLVGLILACVLAPLGYFMTDPMFESTAIIHVKPEGDPIISRTPETDEISQYPQFVQTQAAMVESAATLQQAALLLASENQSTHDQNETAYLAWAEAPGAVQRLRDGLTVTAPRNSQLIYIRFESKSAVEARHCVNAILTAYMEQSRTFQSTKTDEKVRLLADRRTALENQLSSHQTRLLNLRSVDEFATTDLRALLNLKVSQLEEVNNQLAWIGITKKVNEGTAAADAGGTSVASPSGSQLDTVDPELATFRRIRDERSLAFENLLRTHGERHFLVARARRQLEAAEDALAKREQQALAKYESTGATVLDTRAFNDGLTMNQLLLKESELLARKENLSRDVSVLSADLVEAEKLQRRIAEARDDLTVVSDRISELEIEGTDANENRIRALQRGSRPSQPDHDRRRALAAAGLTGGFGLSFLGFFILGTLDRRAYRLHQLAEGTDLRCLGVLPDLGRSLQDPESAEMAAHCVHQIRNLLEATRSPGERGVVIAISSPFQGDGKTSIALALGFSYAASGHRTVVVDGDFVGRGLTRQLNLVGANGLKEVLRDGHLNGEIVSLEQQRARADQHTLSALPVGNDVMIGPQQVRKREVAGAFDQLRERFDVVIVDTGPVLGSLECIPIVSAADGVVLSIRRGRQRTRLQECMNYLHSVNAHCFGVVLNCAERSECSRYISEGSLAPTHAQLAAATSSSEQIAGRQRNVLVSAMENEQI